MRSVRSPRTSSEPVTTIAARSSVSGAPRLRGRRSVHDEGDRLVAADLDPLARDGDAEVLRRADAHPEALPVERLHPALRDRPLEEQPPGRSRPGGPSRTRAGDRRDLRGRRAAGDGSPSSCGPASWCVAFGAFEPEPGRLPGARDDERHDRRPARPRSGRCSSRAAASAAPAAPTSAAARASWSSPVAKRELNSSTYSWPSRPR